VEETNPVKLRGLNILGRGESKCKGPVVGTSLQTLQKEGYGTWSEVGAEVSGIKMKLRPLAETR